MTIPGHRTDEELDAISAEIDAEAPTPLSGTGAWSHLRTWRERQQARAAVRSYLQHADEKKAAAAGNMTKARFKSLLEDPVIRSYVESEQIIVAREARVTAAETLADLRLTADMALGRVKIDKVVVTDGVPESFQVHEANLPAAKGALELLGRHLALFTDRTDVSIKLPEIALYMGGQPAALPSPPDEDDWLDTSPP